MSFKKYIIIMIIATVFALAGFGFVLFNIDPYEAGALGFTLFYSTLFFSAVGTLSLVMFVFRWIFNRNQPIFSLITKSFRHGVLLSILMSIFLILEQLESLTWWNMTLIIAMIITVEFFFASHKPGRKLIS